MGNTLSEKLQAATEGLVLTGSQKHILAHSLTRELHKRTHLDDISVAELRELIETAMSSMVVESPAEKRSSIPADIPTTVPASASSDSHATVSADTSAANEIVEIGEDSYRANHVIRSA